MSLFSSLFKTSGSRVPKERRKHKRATCKVPVRFSEINGKLKKPFNIGKAKDISKGGISITSLSPIDRNAYAVLELSDHVISKHVSKKDVLVISSKRLLSKVVWRRLNLDKGLFETGLRFIATENKKKFELRLKEAAR